MQFKGHPDTGGNASPEHLHVLEDPLIPGGGDAEVPLEECVQAMQEEVHA